MLVKELSKPWYEIEALTYKIAAKLGINIEESDLGIYFCKPT